MPHTNALSPPDGTYCTSTYAASYEYLCCPLRVPAAYLGLNFAASSKKYLSSYRWRLMESLLGLYLA
jgi:hypothetical protein